MCRTGGAVQQGEHHLRRELGGVVGERAPRVRGLQRLHGLRLGRAARRARLRALWTRAPRHARAAGARRHRAVHRLLGRHHTHLGVGASTALRACSWRPPSRAYCSTEYAGADIKLHFFKLY